MQAVAVIGGSGYIGKAITKEIAKIGNIVLNIDIIQHPFRINRQPPEYIVEQFQTVIGQYRAVGKNHAFGRAVGYVALMPERYILHRRRRVPADQPGNAG